MTEFHVAFIEDDRGSLIVSDHRAQFESPALQKGHSRHQKFETLAPGLSVGARYNLAKVAPELAPIRRTRDVIRHCLRTGWEIGSVEITDAMIVVGVFSKPGSNITMHVRGEPAFFDVIGRAHF
ncbi:hypothetical protein [Robbsia sp. KACC 23696]|uniref:hypothetical protein n=1 Tax=Robbsia sp. KACC 23696 TaxID=3149231 RepID=UPI00325AF18C